MNFQAGKEAGWHVASSKPTRFMNDVPDHEALKRKRATKECKGKATAWNNTPAHSRTRTFKKRVQNMDREKPRVAWMNRSAWKNESAHTHSNSHAIATSPPSLLYQTYSLTEQPANQLPPQDAGICAGPDRTRNVAANLGATVALGGIVACSTALGHVAFRAQHVRQRCNSTCAQTGRLIGLSIDPQTKWSVLHKFLQHRDVHLTRNTWWHLLAATPAPG